MHAHGGPDVVSVDELPPPRPPRGDELLVRVAASSVNGSDLGLRRGGMRVLSAARLPVRLGFDLVGEVVGRGPRVSAFGPGDRVAALLGHGGGAQADLVLLRQHRAARVPAGLDEVPAASVPLAGLTALQALFRVAGLGGRPRARVLVLGASGGVGAFAVQLAALGGAHVTGVGSGPKLDRVRAWGAAEVVDRRSTHVADLDDRWDVVLDAHGRSRYADLRRSLRPGGVVVSTRPLSPDLWRAAPTASPRRGRWSGFAVVTTRPRSHDLAHLLDLVAREVLVAPVDSVHPVEQVRDAHRRAETDAAGKVVLRL